MAPVKPQSPEAMLEKLRLEPKHSWGQNFLGDDGVLEAIADEVAVGPGDVVVELGAGLGHLTAHLVATGAKVVAVERDRELVPVLESQGGFTVLAANAAELDFAKAGGVSEVVVAGNLPYHLSSSILFEVIAQRASVKRAVFLLQQEVVTRIVAGPGGRDTGLLSVLLGLWFEARECFQVGRSQFHPPPKVDSAVLRLDRRPKPLAEVDGKRFELVVKAAFAHRRKTLKNSLQSHPELKDKDLAGALQRANIDGMRRAETLSIVEFAALTNSL